MLTLMFLMGGGCAPGNNTQDWRKYDQVMELSATLRQQDKDPLTSGQLSALLGDPETVLTMECFLGKLKDCEPGPDYFRNFVIPNLWRYLDRCRQVGKRTPLHVVEQEFGRCQVWVYKWKNPVDVVFQSVGGTVLFVTSTEIWQKWSFGYVIYDSRVIYTEEIERKR